MSNFSLAGWEAATTTTPELLHLLHTWRGEGAAAQWQRYHKQPLIGEGIRCRGRRGDDDNVKKKFLYNSIMLHLLGNMSFWNVLCFLWGKVRGPATKYCNFGVLLRQCLAVPLTACYLGHLHVRCSELQLARMAVKMPFSLWPHSPGYILGPCTI